MPYKNCSILRNSKNQYFVLSIASGKLMLDQYTNDIKYDEIILNESVKSFSSDFDNKENISYAFVSKEGKLILSGFPFDNKAFELISVGSSYEISQIHLKIIGENYHLFFLVDEKRTRQSSIYHSRCHNGIWSTEKLLSTTAVTNTSYIIDTYKQYIYFLYCSNTSNEYSLKWYNTELNNWYSSNIIVTLPETSAPSFLISDKGVAVLCYNVYNNNQLEVAARSLELEKENSLWSEEEILSTGECSSINPSIVSCEDNIYVLWEELGLIMFRTFNVLKKQWYPKDVLTIQKNIMRFCSYISLHQNDQNLKSSNMYMIIDKMPNYLLPFDNIGWNIRSDSAEKPSTTTSITEHRLSNIKPDYVTSLRMLIESKNAENEEFKRLNSNLQKELEYLNKIIKTNNEQIQKLKIQIDFNDKRYKTSIDEMNARIKWHQEDREHLLATVNKKVQDLTLVINEKEKIITKLYSLLTEFSGKTNTNIKNEGPD